MPQAGGAVVVELAPAGRRFSALVIDLALATVSLAVPSLAAAGIQAAVNPDGNGYWMLGTWLLGYVWLTFYGAAFIAIWGGTPGLLLTGLRVARVWEGYERPSWQSSLRRSRFLAALGWLIPVVNIFVVLVRLGNVLRHRPYHQSTFDTVTGTVVVKRVHLRTAA